MSGTVRAALGFLLFGLLVASSAKGASASCASDSGPSGAPVIFVGTAEYARRGFTEFSVIEVWAGPELAPRVWVQSGQGQPPWPLSLLMGVGSSNDAEFRVGARYVVGASKGFKSGACSTAELSAGLVRDDRPEQVRTPVADGAEGADPPIGPVGQGLWTGGIAIIITTAIAVFRRRKAGAPVR